MKRRYVNCDMDGVLVDMDRYIDEHLSPAAKGNDAIMWPELEKIPNFYRKMKPTSYARVLWLAIMDTNLERRLLTAVPRVTPIPTAEQDKNAWVDIYQNQVFCGERPQVLIGPYSRDKWKHCQPGDILIDDRDDNCASWETAGGIAILHDGDVYKTIAELQRAAR